MMIVNFLKFRKILKDFESRGNEVLGLNEKFSPNKRIKLSCEYQIQQFFALRALLEQH